MAKLFLRKPQGQKKALQCVSDNFRFGLRCCKWQQRKSLLEKIR